MKLEFGYIKLQLQKVKLIAYNKGEVICSTGNNAANKKSFCFATVTIVRNKVPTTRK